MSGVKIGVLKCRDCGRELNTTAPFPAEDEGKVRISSGLAAGPCPNGCRSTFSDMNLNTELVIEDVTAPTESAAGPIDPFGSAPG